jgi:3-(3-hydroxy-phenyl)propionate hydroxylase
MGSLGISHFPVIIVGCGPVGLTTATNIAKQGIQVLVLERSDQVDQSPRAASYQPCAQAEFMETGTYDDIRKNSIINDVLTFWADGERKAFVRKSEGGSIFPSGINCPQPKLAEILLEHLIAGFDAQCKFRQQVVGVVDTGDNVVVTAIDPHTLAETQYTADWVVGADGAGSAVRKLMKIDFEG